MLAITLSSNCLLYVYFLLYVCMVKFTLQGIRWQYEDNDTQIEIETIEM